MLELLVITFYYNEVPAIGLYRLDDLPYLHSASSYSEFYPLFGIL